MAAYCSLLNGWIARFAPVASEKEKLNSQVYCVWKCSYQINDDYYKLTSVVQLVKVKRWFGDTLARWLTNVNYICLTYKSICSNTIQCVTFSYKSTAEKKIKFCWFVWLLRVWFLLLIYWMNRSRSVVPEFNSCVCFGFCIAAAFI